MPSGVLGPMIGEAADAKAKYRSRHDHRRAFGERWTKRVMPPVLKELMRHESIETTLDYDVGLNAESIFETVHQAVNTLVNRAAETSPANETTLPETIAPTGIVK